MEKNLKNNMDVYIVYMGFPRSSVSKQSDCNVGDLGSIPEGKTPWRRKWQPTPVFLPGESHRQRSLAGCSPRSPKQADMTEQLTARNYRRVFQNCHTIFLPASKGWELLLLQGLISTFISSGFLRFVLHCCACFYLSHSDICMMASHCVLNLHFLND